MKFFRRFFSKKLFVDNFLVPEMLISRVQPSGDAICKRFRSNCKGAWSLHCATKRIKMD